VDGREYWFLSEAEFRARIAADAFLEHAEVHGQRYGTLRSEVEAAHAAGRSVLLDIDVQGGIRIKQREPGAVLVFVLPPSMRVLEDRLRARGTDGEETIARRLRNAPDEIRSLMGYDYVVVNESLEPALADLEAILAAERLRRSRLVDEAGGPGFVEGYLRESAEPFTA
jgi:guanylate kinase